MGEVGEGNMPHLCRGPPATAHAAYPFGVSGPLDGGSQKVFVLSSEGENIYTTMLDV